MGRLVSEPEAYSELSEAHASCSSRSSTSPPSELPSAIAATSFSLVTASIALSATHAPARDRQREVPLHGATSYGSSSRRLST
eukprot:scaffold133396_cov78-Phaeocystis_antarctica.AAC.2